MVLFTGANAGAPAFVLPSITSRGSESLVTSTALRGPNSRGYSQTGSAITGAAAAAFVALVALRRQGQRASRKANTSARKAEQIVMGNFDPQTNTTNYTNPWDRRVQTDDQADLTEDETRFRFPSYTGPVYKGVPVVEGLQFPLDKDLYYPPLEPPAPGVKWGDGRSEDGNWYFENAKTGEKVQYWQGWGKRKSACAVVRIVKGNGQFQINNQDAIVFLEHYPIWWLKACEPLCALSQKNEFDIIAKVSGSGPSGQAGAIRLGLAHAMQEYNFNWRPLLKRGMYLTKDHRTREPKKFGQHSARKPKPYNRR